MAPGTAFLISLMSSSEMSVNAMDRWPVIVPLNDVRGAVNGAAIAVPSRARLTVSARVRTVGVTSLASCHGLATVDTNPRPTSSRSDGTR